MTSTSLYVAQMQLIFTMGQAIHKQTCTQADYDRFNQRLDQELAILQESLNGDSFNAVKPSIGAELEMFLVNNQGLPFAGNQDLIQHCNNPLFQPELNQYNLELNLLPVAAKGDSLSEIHQQLDRELDALHEHAEQLEICCLPIGILPTLTEQDLSRDYLTPKARYLALSDRLTKLKQGPFAVDIRGIENLSMQSQEVTLEGVNTSFQVHLRVPYEKFVNTFNAAQLMTPLVLALSANSPFLLGKRLWHETRIALFKQSIDYRNHHSNQWRQPSRVNFGHGWLRQTPYEVFSEGVALYPAMLPEVFDDRPLSDFCALQNHMGTIWSWNRAVLDTGDDRHLRIEFRTLPAGPTNIDMVANLALLIGWSTAVADTIDHYINKLPFNYAEFNFYRCAQHGLQSNVLWPQQHQHQLTERRVTEVIADMLPLAETGLQQLGVSQTDIDKYLAVIELRLAHQQTASQWQLDTYSRLTQSHDHATALRQVVAEYSNHHLSGVPVAEWA